MTSLARLLVRKVSGAEAEKIVYFCLGRGHFPGGVIRVFRGGLSPSSPSDCAYVRLAGFLRSRLVAKAFVGTVDVLIGTARAVRVPRAAVPFLPGRFRGPAALGYEFQLVLELALERYLRSVRERTDKP